MLKKGLQEPFCLYTDEVMVKLMRDIPIFDEPPGGEMLHSLPNRAKIYYGEDIQMIEILKQKRESPDYTFESLCDWCE